MHRALWLTHWPLYNFPYLKGLLKSATYRKLHDYLMDVVGYVLLSNMTIELRNECWMKLYEIVAGRGKETIIIAHSLGAAMIPHILYYDYQKSGAVPYMGLILMASPLGFKSPCPGLLPDPLSHLSKESHTSRETTLRRFAQIWNSAGNNRMKFLINKNDIVLF